MANTWNEKGSLKGVKGDKGDTGDKGEQGYSFRNVNTALSASASVQKVSITPQTNIQQGDKLVDTNGDVWEIVTVNVDDVVVGSAKVSSIKGQKGDKGDPGQKGEDGTGVNIKGAVDNAESLPGEGQPGDAYVISDTGNLAVWDEEQSKFIDTGAQIKGPQGEKGDTGDDGVAATVKVGTVSTGEPGTQASVINVGDTTNATLNFTIPRGAQGVSGPGVSVGTGAPSSPGVLGECYIDIATGKLYRYEDVEA